MQVTRHILILTLLFSAFLSENIEAQTESKDPKTPKFSVKKTGENTYQIGLIEFDSKTRVISIPVVVNQREGGPIEYILVSEKGKVHEALLTTKASPYHLQIALKLLKYQSGEGDIFDHLLPGEDRKIKGGKSAERGSAVKVEVTWKNEEGKKQTDSINSWTLDGETIKSEEAAGEAMPEHPWNYTGSVVNNGQFLAEIEGSFIAIYLDPVSLFNTTVKGSESDERWGANHRAIPEIGTKAVMTLTPAAAD